MHRHLIAATALTAALAGATASCGNQPAEHTRAQPAQTTSTQPPPPGLITYERTEAAVYGDSTWIVDAATGSVHRLPGVQVGTPAWSPDGRRLVVAVQRPARLQ